MSKRSAFFKGTLVSFLMLGLAACGGGRLTDNRGLTGGVEDSTGLDGKSRTDNNVVDNNTEDGNDDSVADNTNPAPGPNNPPNPQSPPNPQTPPLPNPSANNPIILGVLVNFKPSIEDTHKKYAEFLDPSNPKPDQVTAAWEKCIGGKTSKVKMDQAGISNFFCLVHEADAAFTLPLVGLMSLASKDNLESHDLLTELLADGSGDQKTLDGKRDALVTRIEGLGLTEKAMRDRILKAAEIYGLNISPADTTNTPNFRSDFHDKIALPFKNKITSVVQQKYTDALEYSHPTSDPNKKYEGPYPTALALPLYNLISNSTFDYTDETDGKLHHVTFIKYSNGWPAFPFDYPHNFPKNPGGGFGAFASESIDFNQ